MRFLPIALVLAALLVLPRAAQAEPPTPKPDQWIVELDAAPSKARPQLADLQRRQDAALAAVAPGVKPDAEYRTALAGFAANLSDQQAEAMRSAPGVKRVTRERFLQLHGIAGSEAALLGLPGGLWQATGGPKDAGRGVIVGVVDSGITPESPSFADRGLDAPASWDGACEGGEAFPTTSCNDKLIGARYFAAGWGDELPEGTYRSPRDEAGHGTHVAAAAVGDRGVDPVIGGNPLGVDRLTGAAPAAHLAVYKACWVSGSCSNVDVIAAVDRAVRDGVDVLNLSLGGPRDGRIDPLEEALLNADAAGVFVAVSAGNSGDQPGAVANPAAAPWTTAVAATTGARTFRTTLHAAGPGGRVEVAASGVVRGVANAQLVDARAWSEQQPDPFDDPRYCLSGMTPERVAGKVVICDIFSPLEMVADELEAAGAVGLVVPVTAQSDDPAIAGTLPTLYTSDAAALRGAVAGRVATLAYAAASATPWAPDRVAGFSSRGPSDVTGDLLRPDVAAPGVNVLAAYAPDTYFASIGWEPRERFAALSGTSMSSPQVAGAGALLTQLHPTWSPAAIRSALVTTARTPSPPTPHVAAGAGRVDPTAAADPGLVVEPSTDEYRRYAADALAARDLNLPSISLDGATGPVRLQRTVTSVGAQRATYTVAYEGESPWEVRVSPARFTLAPGQRQTLTIEVAADTGSREFRDGTIVLRSGARTVRMPVALHNPGIVDPPARIALSGAKGEQPVSATVAAEVSGVAHGLAAPEVRREQETIPQGGTFQEYVAAFDVPQGAALFGAEIAFTGATPGIYGFSLHRDSDGDGRFGPLDETVNHSNHENNPRDDAALPEPGRYFVHLAADSEAPVRFDLRTWTVRDPAPDEGFVLDGDPQQAFPAAERTFRLRWDEAALTEPLRGVVVWKDGERTLGTSVVDVTP